MRRANSDNLVKALTAFTSFAFYFLSAGFLLILIALPLLKAFGGPNSGFHYSLEVPVNTPELQSTVQTIWGAAPVEVDDVVRAKLQLPLSILPWGLVMGLWIYTAISGGLMVTFLHKLRTIFRSIRDGAAFDAQNAIRLRALGALLLAIAVLRGFAETTTGIAVRRGLATGASLEVPMGLHVDGTLILVGLLFIALAEVFRRGAELEHEQSLVV